MKCQIHVCYWLIHDDIGSVKGSIGQYLVVLGQANLVLIGIKRELG